MIGPESNDDDEDLETPTSERIVTFAAGSGDHDLDALLAAYLLDVDVTVPVPDDAALRVLIAEPDGEVRRALAGTLEAAGHSVVTALSAVAALAMIAHEAIDLVVADDGRDASGRWLRNALAARDCEIPVVLMSDDPALGASPAETGTGVVVAKPVRGLALLAAIREADRGRRR